MRRPIIGHLARALGGIPVERPQDLGKRGSGVIMKIDGNMIHGLETKFKTECKVNDSILAVYNFVILA
jgi:glycerol-3-phosphate O-acyltransferase/dihydroxyacetone phosphate acyltransferase